MFAQTVWLVETSSPRGPRRATMICVMRPLTLPDARQYIRRLRPSGISRTFADFKHRPTRTASSRGEASGRSASDEASTPEQSRRTTTRSSCATSKAPLPLPPVRPSFPAFLRQPFAGGASTPAQGRHRRQRKTATTGAGGDRCFISASASTAARPDLRRHLRTSPTSRWFAASLLSRQ